jgi:1-acyl-sn-glycerol-3-phosphate acyltransferase
VKAKARVARTGWLRPLSRVFATVVSLTGMMIVQAPSGRLSSSAISVDLATRTKATEDTGSTVDSRVGATVKGERVESDERGWALTVLITVLRPLLMVFTRRDWRGTSHLPRTGGCVIAVNHVSEFDPLSAAHFVYDNGRWPRFLGKAEVFAVPVVGRVLRSAGQIPVYRQSDDAAKAFSAAVAAVRSGRCVVVYPEGTITREPGGWPMVGKTGAARIALSTGCPLVPVAQWGPQEILKPYDWRPRLLPRKLMQVRAGEPIDLSDLADDPITPELLKEATERVMAAITRLLEEIRGEPAPVTRYDPKVEGVTRTGRPGVVPPVHEAEEST